MKYWSIFKTQMTNNLAYPFDLATRSLSIVIFMWIFTQLWRATYRSATGADDPTEAVLSGLSLRDTLWYLMLAETIVLSKARFARSISTAVKDGSIAYLLNKPYNFLIYQGSIGLADSLLNMVFNVTAGSALVWVMVGPPPSPTGWPLTLIAVLLGWLIDFCISSVIGLAAFITEEVAAFEWIYSKLLFLFGGLLIPLDFFPGWLRTISSLLPFAYTVYGPARFFVDPNWPAFLSLLAGQLVWLSVLGLLAAVLYQRGAAWLSINGG